MKAARRPEFVQSLERGLLVIRCFSRESPALSLSEVARRTRLTRAAARRFLLTLEALGYVASVGRLFTLRPRVLELGYAYLASLALPELARPSMEALVEQVRESSALVVLDGPDVVYVARVAPKRLFGLSLPQPGGRLPAYAVSSGRVLLAALSPPALAEYLKTVTLRPLTRATVTDPRQLRRILDEVRARDWALVDQEIEDGIRSVAVPLRDGWGAVVAALNLSTPTTRVSLEKLERELLPLLQAAAKEISAGLGQLSRRPALA